MGTVRSKDGTTIAFDVWGDGQPLIVVDGATAYRGVNLTNAEVGQLLREEFRVYAYDRRGRGESTDTAPYAVQREIEDLAALIDHAGTPAVVFGWSSGAVLALDAAAAGLPISRLTPWSCSSPWRRACLPRPCPACDGARSGPLSKRSRTRSPTTGGSWEPPCRVPPCPAIAGPRSPSPSWSCTAPAPSHG